MGFAWQAGVTAAVVIFGFGLGYTLLCLAGMIGLWIGLSR